MRMLKHILTLRMRLKMITSSGPLCDVCGDYILLDKSMEFFHIDGISTKMCCHLKCKKILVYAIESSDWRILPVGPLRKFFEDQK